MRLDKQLELENARAVTAALTAAASTNVIDLQGGTRAFTTDSLGNTPIDDAGRSDIELLVQVVETFAGGTSMTVAVATSAAADLSSPTTLHATPAIATATLVRGYQFRVSIPRGLAQRYLGLLLTSVGIHTTGRVSAWVLPEGGVQTNPTV